MVKLPRFSENRICGNLYFKLAPNKSAWRPTVKTTKYTYQKMKSPQKHLISLAASALVTTLLLGGLSSAATLCGLAQPRWESDSDSFSDGTSVNHFQTQNSEFISPPEESLKLNALSTEENFIMGEGSISCESAAPFQSGASGVYVVWSASDPAAAVARFYMTNSDSDWEARRLLIGTQNRGSSDWRITSESNKVDRFIDDYNHLRGSRESVLKQDLTLIPEPSFALLGALGGFLLLRRRKINGK